MRAPETVSDVAQGLPARDIFFVFPVQQHAARTEEQSCRGEVIPCSLLQQTHEFTAMDRKHLEAPAAVERCEGNNLG